jgi:hypothetical protein
MASRRARVLISTLLIATAFFTIYSGPNVRVSGQAPSTITTTVFTTIINTVTSTTWFTSTSTVLGVLTTVLFTTTTSTTTISLPDVAGGTSFASGGWASIAYCSSFVATRSGSVTTLGVNVKSGVGNVRLGLFDASFNLIAQTGSTSIASASGWVDAPVLAPGSITGAGTYWLCVQTDNNAAVIYYSTLAGAGRDASMAYGAYPATLSPSTVPWLPNLRVTYS